MSLDVYLESDVLCVLRAVYVANESFSRANVPPRLPSKSPSG
jgi:hypothetical protein